MTEQQEKKSGLNRLKWKKYAFCYGVMAIPLISFAIFYVYINASSFALAFQSVNIRNEKAWVGLANFEEFFAGIKGDSRVWKSIGNSLKMWWINFAITMPLYLIFSYYIYKKFLLNNFYGYLMMVPSIVSTFIYALVYKKFVEVGLKQIFIDSGMSEYPAILTDLPYAFWNNIFFTCWISFGTSVTVYTNAMRAIDDEILESARLDGVNDRQEFFSIILPLIWPTISTFVVTGVAGMFTTSGSLLTFYMYDAPEEIWGFGYYITRTIKTESNFVSYPMISASGLVVTIMILPIVFATKALMNKLDKTEDSKQ